MPVRFGLRLEFSCRAGIQESRSYFACPGTALWSEYAPIVYPATSEKAVANHGLAKQVDARYEDGQ
jgi:hypothetical protein